MNLETFVSMVKVYVGLNSKKEIVFNIYLKCKFNMILNDHCLIFAHRKSCKKCEYKWIWLSSSTLLSWVEKSVAPSLGMKKIKMSESLARRLEKIVQELYQKNQQEIKTNKTYFRNGGKYLETFKMRKPLYFG